MSVTSFIHVNKVENHDFDLEKFSRKITQSYSALYLSPGTSFLFPY